MNGYFFRTIEAITDFVVVVAHDGNGTNHLFVYNTKLDLLAEKIIKIKKTDFSINTSRHQLTRCIPTQSPAVNERPAPADLRDLP